MKRKRTKKRRMIRVALPPAQQAGVLDRLKRCEQSIADQERIRESVGQWIVAKRLVRHAQQKMQEAAENMDRVVLAALHRQDGSASSWTADSAAAAAPLTTDTRNGF